MKIEFTREQRITNALMLHSTAVEDCGLLHGKMGIALYFHHLARSSGNAVFAEFASELIDNVTESLHADMPLEFASGITGIGWAVEHLIQNGFVEADADNILEEFDAKVTNTLIHSDNNIETLLSIGHYYISRLRYRANDEENLTALDLKYNTILFIDELERKINADSPSADVLYLLDELHKINVFNYKVEKIRAKIPPTEYDFLVPFVPRLTRAEVETLLDSSDVKSKYAGYDMSSIPETERWGVKNGIAGIGLQKIINDNDLR